MINAAMEPLCLDIRSDPARVAEVRHTVEAFCRSHGFDEKSTAAVGLCVNEAMANVICHAYRGAVDKPIQLRCGMKDDALRLTLRDWGTGEDPTQCARRKKDPLAPGGLGLVCLRELMDEVTYTRQPDGMLLTVVKHKVG